MNNGKFCEIFSNKFFPLLYAKHFKNVDILPHQVYALYGLKNVINGKVSSGLVTETGNSIPYGVLLADETGLGKTVIISLYLLYLKIRGLANNVLIASPKSITYQWRNELLDKASLKFEVINSGRDFEKINNNKFNIIVSIDLLKTTKGIQFIDKLNNYQIDVAVIDEAHHVLSANDTLRRRMIIKVREKSKSLLLATATPFRGVEEEEEFIRHLLGQEYIFIRRIKENIVDTDGNPIFKPRKSLTKKIELDFPWNFIYDRLNKMIDRLNKENIIKLILKKRLASSVYSFLITYNHIIDSKNIASDKITAGTDDVLGKEPDSKYQFTYPKVPPAIEDYYNFNLLEPKEEYLIRDINRLLEEFKSKIIIFTEYLSTLRRLESVFERHNIRFLSVNGKIRQNDRHEIIRRFKNDKEINVLLATDVAGEGLNMQFASLQINYDLPWSPLKLEQRFGRLHRYGQKNKVYLMNLYVENTLDSRIVELLINKFDGISKRLGVDWIFDYIGDFVGEREILQVIQGNPISIDMNKISYIRSSVASPKEINLDYVKEFIMKNEYILNKNKELFNIIYLIDNARQIAEECNTKYIS